MPVLDPIQKTEAIKIGRKKAADLLTHKNGFQILVVNRTMKDIVRGRGNKLISHGMEADEACWPMETLLLSRMRLRKVPLIAIKVKSNQALYVSRLSSWMNDSAIYNRRKRNGSVQRILSMSHFSERPGIIKL